MTDIAVSAVPAQIESVQFNNPVSEASLASIGAICNYLLDILSPVGTILGSMLFDSGDGTHPNNSFQSQLGSGNPNPSTWVLADGRNVAGSRYQTLTGNTTVPDLRGIALRGCNYGGSAAGTRADGNQNPDGSLTPGTYTADRLQNHSHTIPYNERADLQVGGSSSATQSIGAGNSSAQSSTTGNTGSFGADTSPKNVSLNFFIRIN